MSDTTTTEDQAPPKILSCPTQVFHAEHGWVQLAKGDECPDWAVEQITNPRCFAAIEEEILDAEEPEEDFTDTGTGPFEGRKRDQLYAVALQFPEVSADVNTKSLKAEILKALDLHGIEPGTAPEEG